MALRRALLPWTQPWARRLPEPLQRRILDVEGQIAALGEPDPDPVAAATALRAAVPGLRRAAARALGRLGQGRALLEEALAVERCDEVRFALALAAVRGGAPVAAAWVAVDPPRVVLTHDGPRELRRANGHDRAALARRWRRALDPRDPGPGDPADARPLPAREAARLARLDDDPDLLGVLADQGEAADLSRLTNRWAAAGRRERHRLLAALGRLGMPRAAPLLIENLQAVDVDPGFGFTARATAGEALGALGLPHLVDPLGRALIDEALDHEGRPGAGLGIQRPVRARLLLAMGELGAPAAAKLLVGYLGNLHSSALGGLWLPAMDALWRLGDPAPLRPLLQAEEIAAANALGLLVALGDLDSARRALADPRPKVAAVARAALQ